MKKLSPVIALGVIATLVFSLSFTLHKTPFAEAASTTVPQVKVYSGDATSVVSEFLAYAPSFRGGVYVAAGDLSGSGKGKLITGAGAGGAPHVRFFGRAGGAYKPGFFPFSTDFRGGVAVAAGDVNGDGIDELIVSQASKGQAWVKVYDKNQRVLANFLAYPTGFEGGCFVAAGDVDGDGTDEIITGANAGGGPHVRVFHGDGRFFGIDFFPFSRDFRGGVTVAAGDVDGDGSDEVIAAQASQGQAWVKVYRANPARSVVANFLAYPSSFEGGAFVAAGDVNGDSTDEVITGAGASGGPHVRVFTGGGAPTLTSFLAYASDFRGGVHVAAFDFDGNDVAEIVTGVSGKARTSRCTARCVALTFDDGYNSRNNSYDTILGTLERRDVPATFFLLGVTMELYPDRIRRIVRDGFQLANHSYSHPFMTRMSDAQIRGEILHSESIAKAVAGATLKPYFRYPYGAHDARTDAVIAGMGYKHFMWTATTGDAKKGGQTAQGAFGGAVAGLHDGSIILGHTQSDATAGALDGIISYIQNHGYQLVTIQDLDSRSER